MVKMRVVQEVMIRPGPSDEHGNRQDVVTIKGINAEKFIHVNALSSRTTEWRWRLAPKLAQEE